MPINNINDIEKFLRLEEGTLSAALQNEEGVDIQINDQLIVRTQEEINTREKNLTDTAKVAAVEIAVKTARNELGLSFEGKTMDNLIAAHKLKIESESQAEPNEQIQTLKSDNEKLRGNLEIKQGEIEGLNSQFKEFENKTTIGRQVDSAFLSAVEGKKTTIPMADMKDLFMTRTQLDVNEGKTVLMQNGEPVKDSTTLEPIPLDSHVTEFVNQYIKPVEGGGGGGNEVTPRGQGTYEAFEEEMTKAGIQPNSEAFNKEMAARTAAGTLKF